MVHIKHFNVINSFVKKLNFFVKENYEKYINKVKVTNYNLLFNGTCFIYGIWIFH